MNFLVGSEFSNLIIVYEIEYILYQVYAMCWTLS